jgi:hypothetical protein
LVEGSAVGENGLKFSVSVPVLAVTVIEVPPAPLAAGEHAESASAAVAREARARIDLAPLRDFRDIVEPFIEGVTVL